jgi:hypothetical protein
MRINFLEVSGHVAIDDRYSFQEATSGLAFETAGKQYIIIVGENSNARLVIGSETLSLGPKSVMHVNYPRPSLIAGAAHDLRILAGKIWTKFDQGEWKPQENTNAVVGVRG